MDASAALPVSVAFRYGLDVNGWTFAQGLDGMLGRAMRRHEGKCLDAGRSGLNGPGTNE